MPVWVLMARKLPNDPCARNGFIRCQQFDESLKYSVSPVEERGKGYLGFHG
jgi:hypothetical protein